MDRTPHEIWMNRALEVAERSLPEDVPVGAVLLNGQGEVIGEGWNTREVDCSPIGHAELMAITEGGTALKNWRLTDCTLYVTLEPCPMCASALYQARLGKLVFGATDPIQGALGSALNMGQYAQHKMTVLGGIMESECQSRLQQFFKAKR